MYGTIKERILKEKLNTPYMSNALLAGQLLKWRQKMNFNDIYMTICKGHLLADKIECPKCKMSKGNQYRTCYRPVLINREYEKQSIRTILRKIKEDTNIFDSQQTKSNIPYGDGTTVRNDGSTGNKTADTNSQQTKPKNPLRPTRFDSLSSTEVNHTHSGRDKTADTYSDDEGTYFKRFEMEEEA